MKVSIIIPCYNHEKYIDDCLKSICSQKYKDIEVVICDDCSKDDSYKKILLWEPILKRKFSNVIIEKNTTNLGVVKTLNKMIVKSTGEYIKILASDDMLLPDAINYFMEALDGSDVYFSNVAVIPEETKYSDVNLKKYRKVYNIKPLDGEGLTGNLCGRNYIVAPGAIIPRKTFEEYGLYDEQYCLEDFEYWLRVSIKGRIRYIDSTTTLYRDNNNSLSRFEISKEGIARHYRFYKDKMKIFYTYEQYANQKQVTEFYNSELDSAIGTNDVKAVKEIKNEMKKRKIRVLKYNAVRTYMVLCGVYPFLKKIKNKIIR